MLVGIDLSWQTDRNNSGLAYGSLENDTLTVEGIRSGNFLFKDVVEFCTENITRITGMAIDAPLMINNEQGHRECEKQVSEAYGSRKASCHSTNRIKYPDAKSVEFAGLMEKAGFRHLAAERFIIEVYPHPALIEIFGLPERLPYKKGTVSEKRKGLIELRRLITTLSQSGYLMLVFSEDAGAFLKQDINCRKGKALKEYEDALDAVICLYLAGLWQKNSKNFEVFEDETDGYIAVPDSNTRKHIFSK